MIHIASKAKLHQGFLTNSPYQTVSQENPDLPHLRPHWQLSTESAFKGADLAIVSWEPCHLKELETSSR